MQAKILALVAMNKRMLNSDQREILCAMIREGSMLKHQLNEFIDDFIFYNEIDAKEGTDWVGKMRALLSKYFSRPNGMSEADLEDAVQAVFAKLFGDGGKEFLAKWDPEIRPFESFLMVRTNQIGLDEYRKIKSLDRKVVKPGDLPVTSANTPDVLTELYNKKDSHKVLAQIFSEVEKSDRSKERYMVLAFIRMSEGENKASIARGLGISRNAITQYVKRIAAIIKTLQRAGKVQLLEAY